MASMTLQARIREAVEATLARGLSLADIAKQAHVTQSALTQWMNGSTKSLKAASAAALEAVTGYRATWLSSGKGPKLAGSGWPFVLFTEDEFMMLDEATRQDIEDTIAGKIQRARMKLGNGTTGRPFT